MLASVAVLARLTAVAVAGCCLLPAAAHAGYKDVIRDCSEHDALTRTYTQREYREALAHMPTNLKEYSDCADIIHRAQLAAAGRKKDDKDAGAGSSGAAPPAPPTAAETADAQKQVVDASRDRSAVDVAGDRVSPGSLAYRDFGSVSRLPGPLMVVALLIVGAALMLAALAVRGRVGRRHPRT